MPVDHYENFPVASFLLPRRLRPAVEAIYAFARSADDIADEGSDPPEQRLAELAQYHTGLHGISKQGPGLPESHPRAALFVRLDRVIHGYQLPLQPFFDLLSAFEQDISVKRYETQEQLMHYCSRSANPVGRLMLHLYAANTPQNLEHADAICTGLQLANFWQDVAIDWDKGRIYLPQHAMRRHGVTESHVESACRLGQASQAGPGWQALMAEQVSHARRLLLTGAPLAARLPGRMGFELRLVVLGGLRILERLDTLNYDVFRHRPTLAKRDWLVLLWRALNYPRHINSGR